MKFLKLVAVFFFFVSIFAGALEAADLPISPASEECLGCHEESTPQIVQDWRNSLHARMTLEMALKKGELERRVSIAKTGETAGKFVVGCAECHNINPEKHKDTFEHADYKVHVVVTPDDCATCHPVEKEQYMKNKMANAYGNLMKNPVYLQLLETIVGVHRMKNEHLAQAKASDVGKEDACLACHGTIVEVKEMKTMETDAGEMVFPVLTGWPNQGVGRINPDGSMGACTSCHPRHQFSIEVARKPYTCSQCHSGPDVPAYKIYSASKHGNIYSSLHKHWDFNAVPWTPGKDFNAPTCAVCHVSLLTNTSGDVISQRTHQMNDRLPWRIFGVIYSHPEPRSADTSIIKNKAGLPLATELTGEPASEFLIDKAEENKRLASMKTVCLSCHTTPWTDQHFTRLKKTMEETDRAVLASTQLMLQGWKKGLANGMDKGDNIFNEYMEKLWVRTWLFYANSIRMASAMMAADYGVFHNGRWELSQTIEHMKFLLKK